MATNDATDFIRALEGIETEVVRDVLTVQEKMLGVAYEVVVERSPVVTGAYAHEHLIERGIGEGGEEGDIYQSPDRVGPLEVIDDVGAYLERPSTSEAQEAVLGSLSELGPAQVANRRFYADKVEREYGYYVYEGAAQDVEAEGARLAGELDQKKYG